MSAYPHNLAMIAPEDSWSELAMMLQQIGWALGTGIGLSESGSNPATHRAIHACADDSIVLAATGQSMPSLEGFSQEQIATVLAKLMVQVEPYPSNALTPLLAQTGLRKISD